MRNPPRATKDTTATRRLGHDRAFSSYFICCAIPCPTRRFGRRVRCFACCRHALARKTKRRLTHPARRRWADFPPVRPGVSEPGIRVRAFLARRRDRLGLRGWRVGRSYHECLEYPSYFLDQAGWRQLAFFPCGKCFIARINADSPKQIAFGTIIGHSSFSAPYEVQRANATTVIEYIDFEIDLVSQDFMICQA